MLKLETKPTVTGRFAPSPSGRMHLGNAFAALLCWLSARAQGGRLIMRIEDLDTARCKDEYAQTLMDDLIWLGLDWDEGAAPNTGKNEFYQSTRADFYEKQIEALRQKGLVYPCFCTRAELHAQNAPHQSDGIPIYSGQCAGLSAAAAEQLAKTRAPALRVRVPDITLEIHDKLQGTFTQNLKAGAGDFVLRRSDGLFAYQLAATADDGAMGVTEVVRGRDLLESAPRQAWLMQTLGYTPPSYAHLPLLLAPDGRRLSKREKDLDMGALRQSFKHPQNLVGFLAHTAGLLPKSDAVSAEDLISEFKWSKVTKHDIVVDLNNIACQK